MSETEKINIKGYKRELEGGREVFVGLHIDKSIDDVFVSFTNKEGEKTHLRLSKEAADALGFLLMDRDKSRVERWVFQMAGHIWEKASPERSVADDGGANG